MSARRELLEVENGIRLTGMPAYDRVPGDTEMWQVTLLVANADKLSPAVTRLLEPLAK